MSKRRKMLCILLAFAMVCSVTGPEVQAKKKIKLNKKKLSLMEGTKRNLRVMNTKKKVKWSSSKKKIATVNKKGVVRARKPGKAVITAKVGKKKLKCKVTVNSKCRVGVYKTVKIEDFESYAVGTDWGNYTLGEGLTSGGDEKPHYLAKDETMKVVADPENPSNKVLQVKPKFYSFCPVFTVDLSKLPGMSGRKLGDFAGIHVKVRVVSDASCHVGIGLGAFFGQAGTINKKYAFNTYTTQEQALPAEREYYKFFHTKGMVTGATADDGKMPQYDPAKSKHMAGHKFAEADAKAGFGEKLLLFNDYLTQDLRNLAAFDFVVGGSYGTPANDDYLAWYLDDVELWYR